MAHRQYDYAALSQTVAADAASRGRRAHWLIGCSYIIERGRCLVKTRYFWSDSTTSPAKLLSVRIQLLQLHIVKAILVFIALRTGIRQHGSFMGRPWRRRRKTTKSRFLATELNLLRSKMRSVCIPKYRKPL
jgi:hypothetical protein